MAVTLGRGIFLKVDGRASDDFEVLTAGTITTIPGVTGTAGCDLGDGYFLPRM